MPPPNLSLSEHVVPKGGERRPNTPVSAPQVCACVRVFACLDMARTFLRDIILVLTSIHVCVRVTVAAEAPVTID